MLIAYVQVYPRTLLPFTCSGYRLNTRTLVMSVGEIEDTEINPFGSRVVQVNREAKDDRRQFELPSVCYISIVLDLHVLTGTMAFLSQMMFAAGNTATIQSETDAEAKDERVMRSGLLDDNDHPNGSHTMVGV